MKEQIQFQIFLEKALKRKKEKNPAYSLRAFAKQLGISPSSLSEILKGQRRVSIKIAERIINQLDLTSIERASILKDFQEKDSHQKKIQYRQKLKEKKEFLKMASNQFQLISNWVHLAILSLIKTKNFQYDTQWIAKRLSTTNKNIEKAIKRLIDLELIQEQNNSLIRTSSLIRIDSKSADQILRKSYINDMDLAKSKLNTTKVYERDFTSMTLPSDPELIPKAKEIIRNAHLQLEELMESGRSTEVYKFSTQLYPLSQEINGDKK